MGSYTFKWEHPAEEVYVTGTFDSWTKSVKLEKRGDIFEKTVDLEIPSDKIYYKFVVDNTWTTNESSPKEADKEGNVNNFLTSEVIAASTISTTAINTAAPGSTTATMAGQQPLEKDKLVGINPLPASETGVNPVNLKPGDKIPHEFAAGDINKHVKLDKDSYEKSDSLVGIPNPADVPAAGPNTIPESSLPMPQNATINTVAPGATTAGLAAQVPVESKAAEPTSGDDKKKKKNKKKNEKKKQKKAAAAAANGNGNANANDNDNDDDSDEPEQKADSGVAGTAAAVGGSAAAVAAAVAAGATAAASKVNEQVAPSVDAAKAAAAEAVNKNLPESAKEKLPESVKEALGQPANDVPAEVKESIQEAGKSPEAAANAVAVEEKKAVESELLKEVKPAPAADEAKVEQPVVAAAAAEKDAGKPVEKPVETAKAPALETAAPVVAPVVAPLAPVVAPKPAENSATKVANEAAIPKPAEPQSTGTKVSVSKPVTLSPAPQAESTPVAAPVAQAAETKAVDTSAPKVAEVPKPTETTPAVSKPETIETKPAETKPAETKPAETKPAEVKPVETKPEVKPAETKPVEAKSEAKPAETKPAEKPTTANGSGAKPAVAAAADKAEAAGEKKKGGLSRFISKIKAKLSDKN